MGLSSATTELSRALNEEERAKLRRILMRAEADCEAATATVGTGAQSSKKRAKAVLMTLENKPIDEIAQHVSLSSARVSQVVTMVAAHGISALYPAFEENNDDTEVPDSAQLWEIARPLLLQRPGSLGYRADKWSAASVLDALIHRGSLEDGSVPLLKKTIELRVKWDNGFHIAEGEPKLAKRLGKFKIEVGGVETEFGGEQKRLPVYYDANDRPSTGSFPEGSVKSLLLIVAILVIGVGMILTARSEEWLGSLFLYVLGGLFALISAFMIYRWIEEKKLARAMFGRTAALADSEKVNISQTSLGTDLPQILIRHANTLPRTVWNLPGISQGTNVSGRKPVPTIYLWVFQAHSREQWGYETQGWLQTGPLHILLNGSALPLGALRKSSKLLMNNGKTVREAVSSFKDEAGEYPRPSLFYSGPAIGKKRFYRGYPLHTMVCTNEVWRDAFEACRDRSEFAVFNLSGYQPGHPGIEFEVAHVLTGGKPDRFVFMYDRHTEADAAIDSILRVWQQLPAERRPETLVFLRYQDAQPVGYGKQWEQFSGFAAARAELYLESEGEFLPIASEVIDWVSMVQRKGVAA